MFYLFREKRGVKFSMAVSPSGDDRHMTRIESSGVYGIDDTGLVLVDNTFEWPEQIHRGLEYLGENDPEALFALCAEVSAEVKQVFGGSIFERLAAAADIEGDNEVWLNETVENIRNFCVGKVRDLLRIYGLSLDANRAVALENSQLRRVNSGLQVELREANEENEGLRRELEEETELNKILIEDYVNTNQRDSADPMTGADKAKAFYFDLFHQISSAREIGGKSVAVVMLDLDRFKKVNDTSVNGHADGDTVLKMFVATVKDVLGDRGRIYRLGGEEFALIINASEDEIPEIMQELQDAIYERVYWYQDPKKTGVLPTIGRKTEEFRRGVVDLFSSIFKSDKEPRKESRPKGEEFVSYDNDGIDLGALHLSVEEAGKSIPDSKLKRMTISAGIAIYPSQDQSLLPEWPKSAIKKKTLAIRESLEASARIMRQVNIRDRVAGDSRFDSYIMGQDFDQGVMALMAYLILAGDRASYESKKKGRNGARIVDGSGKRPRNGRLISRCEKAGNVS